MSCLSDFVSFRTIWATPVLHRFWWAPKEVSNKICRILKTSFFLLSEMAIGWHHLTSVNTQFRMILQVWNAQIYSFTAWTFSGDPPGFQWRARAVSYVCLSTRKSSTSAMSWYLIVKFSPVSRPSSFISASFRQQSRGGRISYLMPITFTSSWAWTQECHQWEHLYQLS